MSITPRTQPRAASQLRPRHRTRVLGAALATTALLVPAITGTQAASAAQAKGGTTTTTTTGCTAGALKKDKDGNTTHVCDTHGKWIKVDGREGEGEGEGSVVGQGVLGEAATTSSPGAAPAAQREQAVSGGTSAPVTCALSDGSTANPGERMATVTDYRDAKGKLLLRQVTAFICGADGSWHVVSSRVEYPTATAVAPNTTTTQGALR